MRLADRQAAACRFLVWEEAMLEVREVRESDAGPLLDTLLALDHETKFMMLEPGERTQTEEDQRERIRRLAACDNSVLFVAEQDGKIAGYITAEGGQFRRNRHSATLVAGIRQEFTGQGIGTRLFEAVISWAKMHGLTRLELTVMTHNTRGIALYKKMGFEVEGLRINSLRVDEAYVDEFSMALVLEN